MGLRFSDYGFVLVGRNNNLVPLSYGLTNLSEIPSGIIDPQGMFNPNIGSNTSFSFNSLRNHTSVDLVSEESQEMSSLMSPLSYKRASIMSLDGLLSPISFYPTPYNSTFSITKYTRSKCPWCKGAGTIETRVPNPRALSNILVSEVVNQPFSTFQNNSFMNYRSKCYFCVADDVKQKALEKSVSPGEVFPPYLIASGPDNQIIDTRDRSLEGSPTRINNFTLNPIILSNGEFSCSGSKQPNDNCVHSIDVVGFGMNPPEYGGNLRSIVSSQSNKNFTEQDLDFDNGRYQNNQRFFALRGPIMIHAWGYDKEGYPVPNSSGELQLNNDSEPITDTRGNLLYKNQTLQSDGTYSRPYKERTFRKGWASLPATWPVGPLDLRWDEDAGVWTVGSNYKPVWVTIENSMFNDTPVRAIIEDSVSDATPLPDNKRRLVFVKDPTGLFKAPRGAALYCKYNTDNGFYEPIYNQPFITTGTIRNSNVVDIDNVYTIKYSKNNIVEIFSGEIFTNPLSLPTLNGRKGIFSFIGGKWNLTNVA
jgi:hypothetical protein